MIYTPTSEQSEPSNSDRKQLLVYVIDDDKEVRTSLHFHLSNSGITAWPFSSAVDFLEHRPFLYPAPILLDLRMGDIDGLQLLQILKDRDVSWPTVILTGYGDVPAAVRAMKLGAIDFLEKPYAPALLHEALAEAFAILDKTQSLMSARDQARYRFGQLTTREHEILVILLEGALNKEAAHRLGLSVRTVEMHRAHALAKLQVSNIAGAVKLASIAELNF